MWIYCSIALLLLSQAHCFSFVGNHFHDKVNSKNIFCLRSASECRRNSTCNIFYRRVKKKCTKSVSNECFLAQEDMKQCADDIDWLKNNIFGERCSCVKKGVSVKKIMSCSPVYNMLYANPCYDHGVKARNSYVSTAITSTVLALGTNDVTIVPQIIEKDESEPNDDNRVSNKLNLNLSDHANQNGFEPERALNSKPLDELARDLNSKWPGTTGDLLPIDREAVTFNQRENVDPNSASGKSPKLNEAIRILKEPEISKESDVKINILKKDMTSNDIFSSSDGFREREAEKSHVISDPNAEEVARVVAKYMGDYGMEEVVLNSTDNEIDKKTRPRLVTRTPLSGSVDLENQNNAILSLVALVVSSLGLGIFVVAIIAAFCYRRWKTKGYISKHFVKKTCQHSTIIISALYDSRDSRLKTRADDV